MIDKIVMAAFNEKLWNRIEEALKKKNGDEWMKTPLNVRGLRDVINVHMSIVSDLVAGDYIRLVLNNGAGKSTSIRWSFDELLPLTAELRVYN